MGTGLATSLVLVKSPMNSLGSRKTSSRHLHGGKIPLEKKKSFHYCNKKLWKELQLRNDLKASFLAHAMTHFCIITLQNLLFMNL